MRERPVYKRFRDAVEAQGVDAAAVEMLSPQAVRQMAGCEGMTQTFLKNMRNRLAAKLRENEAETVAAWIKSKVLTRFPQAQTKVRRGRVIEVWLDPGAPGVEDEI